MDPLQNPNIEIAVIGIVLVLMFWSSKRSQQIKDSWAKANKYQIIKIVTGAAILSVFGTLVMLFVYSGVEVNICSGTDSGVNSSAIICAQGDAIFGAFLLGNLLAFPIAYLVVLLETPRHWRPLIGLHIIFTVVIIVFWVLHFVYTPLFPVKAY